MRLTIRVFLVCLAIVLAGAAAVPTARPANGRGGDGSRQSQVDRVQQPPAGVASASPPSHRALLDRYCVTCHNGRRKTAGLELDALDISQVGERGETWEKVLRMVRTRAMPPPGMPRPNKEGYEALASYLETSLDGAIAAHPNPGRPALHRMNRAEYTNAIRDLLAVDIDPRAMLPADDSSYGFDNIADVLSMSPVLLERYMSAARKISRLALGDPTIPSANYTYKQPLVLLQDDRMSDDLPFGSRGGIAVQHHFPADGAYDIKIRLLRHWQGIIRGLAQEEQIEVRVDGERVKVFTVGGKFQNDDKTTIRQRGVRRDPRGPAQSREEQNYVRTADEGLQIRLSVKAGRRLVSASFAKRTQEPEGVGPSLLPPGSFAFAADEDADMALESLQIAGPYNAIRPVETASRARIFVCRPAHEQDEDPCAKRILSSLARRAYRRPVHDTDIEELLGFYRTGKTAGGFEAGVGLALERMLVSPEFLFRVEADPQNVKGGAAYTISDLELASRLSFFLWSSIPDEELLDVAVRGKLRSPAVLERQVRRMLADDRAEALIQNFVGQWLYLRNMRTVAPDAAAFPEFDDNLRVAFQRETELFVASQIREDRGVLDLLTANYTFVNERLARHYNIPNVYGSHFRRVDLPDETRAGLLGQGSILTITSYSTRTSPVKRGAWLLENLLGTPPPPPPPNVPLLKENGEEGVAPTSVRERLEQHRKNPACASCHARMDPLGFSLENFDAVGRWRTISEGNTPVDASAALLDGTKFEGISGLRRLLLDRRDEFINAVTTKLLTYAIGRGTEYYDNPAIRKITRDAARNDYRWSSLILGVINSPAFQMRRAES
jgi:mono/diheme cytochrome c family protein